MYALSRFKTPIVALCAVLVGMLLATAIQYVRADATTTYYACVKADGTIRMVTAGTTCHAHETLISWNQTGPQGAVGPQGPQGPAGGGGGLSYVLCPGCDFSNMSDLGRFKGADFTNAVLTNVVFNQADLTGTIFHSADLNGARFDWSNILINADFTNAHLAGAAFVVSNLDTPDPFQFANNLTGANFSHAEMPGLHVDYQNFAHTNLSNANVTGGSLTHSVFTGANFSYVITSSALGDHGSFMHSSFASANFSHADLRAADLSGATSFEGADFTGADLSNLTDLDNNIPIPADFTGANFTGALHMDTANLALAIWTHATCPDGSQADDHPDPVTNKPICDGAQLLP